MAPGCGRGHVTAAYAGVHIAPARGSREVLSKSVMTSISSDGAFPLYGSGMGSVGGNSRSAAGAWGFVGELATNSARQARARRYWDA